MYSTKAIYNLYCLWLGNKVIGQCHFPFELFCWRCVIARDKLPYRDSPTGITSVDNVLCPEMN